MVKTIYNQPSSFPLLVEHELSSSLRSPILSNSIPQIPIDRKITTTSTKYFPNAGSSIHTSSIIPEKHLLAKDIKTEKPDVKTPNTSIKHHKRRKMKGFSDLKYDSPVESVEGPKMKIKPNAIPFQNAVQNLPIEMGQRAKSNRCLFDMNLISDNSGKVKQKKREMNGYSDLKHEPPVESVGGQKMKIKPNAIPFQNAVQNLAIKMGQRAKSDSYLFDMHLISDCLSPYPSEVKQIVERWYGKLFFILVQYLFNQFQLSEDYYILFLHPGVACRVEVVAEFLRKNPPPYESPVTLFKKFSEYLGSVELHRAIWMPDAYWEQCKNSDSAPTITSRAAWEHTSEAIANTFGELFQTEGDSFETVNPRSPKYNTIVDCFSFVTKTSQAFRKHEVAFERPSPLIPSSPCKEAAVRIAYTISKDVRKTLGVYSFQIPRIETITHTGPFCRADVVSCNIEYQLSGRKKESIPFVNTEYLVIGNIPSAAVTSIESPVYPSSLQTMNKSRDRSFFAKPDFSIRKWA